MIFQYTFFPDHKLENYGLINNEVTRLLFLKAELDKGCHKINF